MWIFLRSNPAETIGCYIGFSSSSGFCSPCDGFGGEIGAPLVSESCPEIHRQVHLHLASKFFLLYSFIFLSFLTLFFSLFFCSFTSFKIFSSSSSSSCSSSYHHYPRHDHIINIFVFILSSSSSLYHLLYHIIFIKSSS